jgi:hypothetical protein
MRYFAVILILLLAGFPLNGQANIPSIVFDASAGDAGKVTEGEIAKQIFAFSNKGTGILEIKNVRPT